MIGHEVQNGFVLRNETAGCVRPAPRPVVFDTPWPRADHDASLLHKKGSEMAENLSAVHNRVELRISDTSSPSWVSGTAIKAVVAIAGCAALASCAQNHAYAPKPAAPQVVAAATTVVPPPAGVTRVATPPVRAKNGTEKPYAIGGKRYVPTGHDSKYTAVGLASWYGPGFNGRKTAVGERFDMTGLSAAHKTMPLPSYARVTNLANGKSVIVRVNDRGPYHGNRLIDVSNTAAKLLEFRDNGIGRVRVEYVGRAPLEGSDDRQLMATLRTGVPAPAPSTVRIASANAFIPELPPSRGVVRGDVPLPSGRPYTLGHTVDDMTAGSSEVSASARATRPAGRRFERSAPDNAEVAEDTPAMARPVAAYAPRDNTMNLMSGRGLY